jgi:hypothetical protein
VTTGNGTVGASSSGIASDVVAVVSLAADDPFQASQQEGGRTIIAGTFTPVGDQVRIEVDVSATFTGWGAGGVDFHVGVIDEPTDPWEPGGKNRLVEANFAGRGPLPGVRPGSYQHFSVGFLAADTSTPNITRSLLLAVEPGLTYSWELRCGGASFFKFRKFAPGSRPTHLAVSADQLHVWTVLSGSRTLALTQLGWAPLWNRFGYSPDMLCLAEVPLPGEVEGIAVQPFPNPPVPNFAEFVETTELVALIDTTHGELVLVDTESLTVSGSYPLPGGARPTARRVVWDRLGAQIYLGGAEDGQLYRFDVATRTFLEPIVVDAAGPADVVPLSAVAPGRAAELVAAAVGIGPPVAGDAPEPEYSRLFGRRSDLDTTSATRFVYCSSVRNGRLSVVDVQTGTAYPFHQYPAGVTAPTAGAARPTTGGIVVLETTGLMACYDAAGTLTSSWRAALDDAEVRNLSGCVCLDDDDLRAFWILDGAMGWAWIDGSHDEEPRPDGRDWITGVFPDLPRATREKRVINKSSLSMLYQTDTYGEVANTHLEGTLVAIPDEDTVIQFPGGQIAIRPDSWFGGVVGTEHATVTFTGATAEGR